LHKKEITVTAKHQYQWNRQNDKERLFKAVLNDIVAAAYRDGYRDRGIFTRIKRRLTKK